MKFGIVSRTDRPEAVKFLRVLVSYLESKNLEVVLETDTSLALELPLPSMDLGEMEIDYLITVGGDGTIRYSDFSQTITDVSLSMAAGVMTASEAVEAVQEVLENMEK